MDREMFRMDENSKSIHIFSNAMETLGKKERRTSNNTIEKDSGERMKWCMRLDKDLRTRQSMLSETEETGRSALEPMDH